MAVNPKLSLSAIVAESLAASKILPFGDFPSLIKVTVVGSTFTMACATAVRNVSDLSPTSNMPTILFTFRRNALYPRYTRI